MMPTKKGRSPKRTSRREVLVKKSDQENKKIEKRKARKKIEKRQPMHESTHRKKNQEKRRPEPRKSAKKNGGYSGVTEPLKTREQRKEVGCLVLVRKGSLQKKT